MRRILFSDFELNLDTFALTKSGTELKLGPRCFALLLCLIENRERYVDKESLRKVVWNGASLSPAAIPTCVRELRNTLGDSASTPRIIVGKKGRGYRFIAPTEILRGSTRAPEGLNTPLPLVNRTNESLMLASALRATSARKRGQLIIVRAGPGLGKTRIVDEFLQEHQENSHALIARGRKNSNPKPFSLWTDLRAQNPDQAATKKPLKKIKKTSPPSTIGSTRETSRAPFADLPREILDATQNRQDYFNHWTSAVSKASENQTLILVFEDAHLADPDSLLLASWIADSLQDSHLLIVVTHRPHFQSPKTALAMDDLAAIEHCKVIELPPISTEQVAEIVRPRLLGEHINAAELQRETAGNPLLLTFKLDSLERQTPGSSPEPETILKDARSSALISRFVGDLPQETQAALAGASHLEIEFSAEELGAALILATKDAHTLLEPAVSAQILGMSTSRYIFHHPLLRSELRGRVSPQQKRQLHANFAGHLLGRADLLENTCRIAHHLSEAIPVSSYEEAVHFCTLAFREARSRHSHSEARKFAELALQISRENPQTTTEERCRLLINVAQARETLGDREAGRTLLLEVVRVSKACGLAQLLPECALAISQNFSSIDVGVYDVTVEQLIREALEATPVSDLSLRAQLMARLSLALRWAEPSGEQQAIARDALELASQSGDETAQREALTAVAEALQGPGHAPERLATIQQLRTLPPRSADCDAALLQHTQLITAHLELGQMESLKGVNIALREMAMKTQQPHHSWYATTTDSMLSLMSGNMEISAELERLFSSLCKKGLTPNILQGYAVQSFFRESECERGQEILPRLRDLVRQFPLVPSWRSALAWLSWDLGDLDSAALNLSHFTEQQICAMRGQVGSGSGLALLSEVAANVGSRRIARILFEIIEPLHERFAAAGYGVLYLGSFARHGGILARTLGFRDQSIELLSHAADQEASRGAELWLGYALLELAMTLGEGEESSAKAESVLTEAERIAMSIRVPRLIRRVANARAALNRNRHSPAVVPT